MALLYWIFLLIDSVVYNFINYAYQIFLLLSRVVLAEEETISPFIQRVYTIIGVVMLFVITYSFLTAIVNPESNVKSMGQTVFGIVKAIILLALVPPLFDFAYIIQDSILDQNTIGRIILGGGGSEKNPADVINNGGIELSSTMIKAFIFPKGGKEPSEVVLEGDTMYTLNEIWDAIGNNGTFRYLTMLSEELGLDNGSEIDYQIIISTGAACYILYLLISYCLSLGLRIIKLLFYEIIAPIPILASILPKKKDMFNKWLSITITTFLEVFIRVGIMYLTVYIASLVPNIELIQKQNNVVGFLANACILMGLFTFVKKAPELIAEVTGIDSSKMSTGIKDQLKSGGLFAAGGFVAGTIAGRGNPLAGIRAARHAHAVGGLTGITQGAANENAYRRSKRVAKASGVGFFTRTAQGLRNYFGMESLGENADRKIEEADYYVTDPNDPNNRIKMDTKQTAALDAEVESNNAALSAISERARKVDINKSSNEKLIGFRKEIKAEALDKIQEDDSKISGSIKDAAGNVVFSGNYSSMNKWLEGKISSGKLSEAEIQHYTNELGRNKNEMWKTYARHAIDQTRDASGNLIVDNGKILTAYRTMRDNTLDAQNGLLRESDGRVITTDATGASLSNQTGMDFVETVFGLAQDKSNAQSVEISNIEREKRPYEQRNADIDRMKKEVEEQKSAKKQTDSYRASQAVSKLEKSKNGSFNEKSGK